MSREQYLGSKGRTSDKDYRTSHLRLLGKLIESIAGIGGVPAPSGLATEATLQALLAEKDYEFQMQYLKDANDTLVWVEVSAEDGVKTYTYYDSPGGSTIVPVQPLKPLSLDQDTELIEDEYIAVQTNTLNGYTIGDIISKISYFDITTATPVLLNSFWYNKSTETILSTVNTLHLEDQDGPILQTPGVKGVTLTSPGVVPVVQGFDFDADVLLIENKSNKDIVATIGGILGDAYIVLKDTSKTVNIDVPHMTDVSINGADALVWTGDVYITYSRSK
jgi:hypothetical protein